MIHFIYKNIIKPILFLQDPEKVHDRFIKFGSFLGRNNLTQALAKSLFYYENPSLEQTICKIKFKNPVGLSAGFDKDANLVNIMPFVGFGFMQVGSVTYKPYAGNPKPRLYRLPKSKAIAVYYGLKNIGAKKITEKLKNVKTKDFPLSISIAQTNCKETANTKEGIDDYYASIKMCASADVGDFYTINISCPNTYGGEPFTTQDKLGWLLEKLYSLDITKPLFLKMPINLEWNEFKELLGVAISFNVSGVIDSVTIVPEPSAIVLLSLGGIMLKWKFSV